ncbi:DUF4179 domain-containing protein [Paenibacillus tarimensis]
MNRPHIDQRIQERLKLHRPVPAEINARIEHTLCSLQSYKRRSKRKILYSTAVAGITACVVLLSLTFAFNSNIYANSVKPFLQSVFGIMGDNGLAEADGNKELPVLTEKEYAGYTLRIHEVQFDGLRLSFSYSLSSSTDIPRQLYVLPDFQLDTSVKQVIPNILKSDSGGVWEDGKIGIVNYFFAGQVPDLLQLKVNVGKLAFINGDSEGQETVSGDWSFELDVQKQGDVREQTYNEEKKSTEDNALFRVIGSRLSPGATEWNLYWELPLAFIAKIENNRLAGYGMKYNIMYDGDKQLVVITRMSSSQIIDKSLPHEDWIQAESIRLLTEPVPEGVQSVKVVPVLMVFPLGDQDQEYSERPLTQFEIEIPIQ